MANRFEASTYGNYVMDDGNGSWYYNPSTDMYTYANEHGTDYQVSPDELSKSTMGTPEKMKSLKTQLAAARTQAQEGKGKLLNDKFQALYSLSTQVLQPTFSAQRGALSEAMQTTGQRRSSTFANSFEKQLSDENIVFAGLLRDTLSKQIDIEEADKNRALQNIMSQRTQDAAQYGADATRYAADQTKASADAAAQGGLIGDIASAFLSGGV